MNDMEYIKNKLNRILEHNKKRLFQFKDRYGHEDKDLIHRLSFHGARDLGYYEGRIGALLDILDEIEELEKLK